VEKIRIISIILKKIDNDTGKRIICSTIESDKNNKNNSNGDRGVKKNEVFIKTSLVLYCYIFIRF